MDNEEEAQWMSVIAKSLAVLAMHSSEVGNSEMMTKAEFLEGLGLSRNAVASMLGTAANSLRVMSSRKEERKQTWQKQKELKREQRRLSRLIESRTYLRCYW